MKLSYSWLKQLVKFKETPEQLASLLTLHVAQVEGMNISQRLDKVITAKIIKIQKHPNADKLQIATVITRDRAADGNDQLDIVCGASNISVGQVVPLALPGARLPNNFEIKESIIRGVKSVGMLCAEDELGIGPDHAGIYIFPSDTLVGQSVSRVLELDDTILEIENKSLTHRPDLFSIRGFARELSAIKNLKYQELKLIKLPPNKPKNTSWLKIKIDDPRVCPRYMAAVMTGIKVMPSPLWLQNCLRNHGIRPINNIVDITNYVLIELGQPLHAFDWNKLKTQGKESKTKNIVIKFAKKEEKMLALDGREYELGPNDLLITDGASPVALAGIIGGEHSGIDHQTKTIVVESALFDPATVRRTSWQLGVRTEAVLRFEKGLPINFPEQGLARAIELIKRLANGQIVGRIYDIQDQSVKKQLTKRRLIQLSLENIHRLIGSSIPAAKIKSILINLGFILSKNKKGWLVRAPLMRPDIEQEEDIIEDVLRIYGTDKIEPQPIVAGIGPIEYLTDFLLEKNIKDVLVNLEFDEVYNYSFYDDRILKALSLNSLEHLTVANPLNSQSKYLRISLIPHLLSNLVKNIALFEAIRVFETGRVYHSINKGFKEEKYLSGVVYDKKVINILDLKAIIENLLISLGVERGRISYQTGKNSNYQYLVQTIGILIDNKLIGLFGEAGVGLKNYFKLTGFVGIFEINLESLVATDRPIKMFQAISNYPPAVRDLSLLVPKKMIFSELLKIIKEFNSLIINVEPFDIFKSEKLESDIYNVALRLTLQSFSRTLKSEEIDKVINELLGLLQNKFQIKLRSF